MRDENYPKEPKLEKIQMFFEEGMTRAEITKAIELRSEDREKIWVRQYPQDGSAAFANPSGDQESRLRVRNLKSNASKWRMYCLKSSDRFARVIPCEAQYRPIYAYQERYKVKVMCTFLGVSRAANKAW